MRLALPPADLAECAEEPLAPDLPAVDWLDPVKARETQTVRDRLTFDFVLAMRSSFGDCKAKVDGLKAWRDRAGK